MDVRVLGVPTSDGTDIRGCELAPRTLRELGLLKMIGGYRRARDLGDITINEENKSENLDNDKIFNYKRVIDFNRALAVKAEEIAEEESFTLFLGGDHSISVGSIAGVLCRFPNTAVVWLDAHADLNTDETSPSRKAHGMSAAALLGHGDELLRQIVKNKLPEKNLFLLCQRNNALDQGERSLIGKSGIYIKTWADMRSEGVVNVMEEILAILKKRQINRMHLSLDIDALAAGFVPGTGTAVADGPDVLSMKVVLRALAGCGMLRSMDFVELNPYLDEGNVTALLSLELLEEIFKYLQ